MRAFHGEWNYSLLPRQRLPVIDRLQAERHADDDEREQRPSPHQAAIGEAPRTVSPQWRPMTLVFPVQSVPLSPN